MEKTNQNLVPEVLAEETKNVIINILKIQNEYKNYLIDFKNKYKIEVNDFKTIKEILIKSYTDAYFSTNPHLKGFKEEELKVINQDILKYFEASEMYIDYLKLKSVFQDSLDKIQSTISSAKWYGLKMPININDEVLFLTLDTEMLSKDNFIKNKAPEVYDFIKYIYIPASENLQDRFLNFTTATGHRNWAKFMKFWTLLHNEVYHIGELRATTDEKIMTISNMIHDSLSLCPNGDNKTKLEIIQQHLSFKKRFSDDEVDENRKKINKQIEKDFKKIIK